MTITSREYDGLSKFYKSNYLKFMPSSKDSNILEVGCGYGYFLYFLKKNNYKNFLGIDMDSEKIKYCKEITKNVKKIEIMRFLRNNKSKYDLIMANHLLEHFSKKDIIPLIKLIRQNLKRNGIFIAQVPNMGSPFSGNLMYSDFTHKIGFTSESLTYVLDKSGFKNIEILPIKAPNTIRGIIANTIRFVYFGIIKLILKSILYGPYILNDSIFCVARNN